MTIFDELQAAYRDSQDRFRDYARESLEVAHTLAQEFRAYLGAPDTFTDPEDDTRRPYVRLLAFQIQDGVPAAVQPESHLDLLAREEDGFWRFALALILDRDSLSFPKQSLAFFLRLKVHDGIWHVQLLDDGVQDFQIPEAATASPEKAALFGRMVAMVQRLLDAKPWEGVEKLPIGFELHHPNPIEGDAAPPIPSAP
jgi:hypothetical protein